MAVKGPCPLPYTLVAGADLSSYQFGAIALDSNGKAVLANVANDAFIGTLENKPKTGEHATVEFAPCITKVKAGLAITAGNYLTVQSGWFIPGQKLTFTTPLSGMPTNLGSKTGLVGIALETVGSGAICTAKLFEHITTINS